MANGERNIRSDAPLSDFEDQLRFDEPVEAELVFLEDFPVFLADRVMRTRGVGIARVMAARQAWFVQQDRLVALVEELRLEVQRADDNAAGQEGAGGGFVGFTVSPVVGGAIGFAGTPGAGVERFGGGGGFAEGVDRLWSGTKCYQCDLTSWHRFPHHTYPDHCAWGDSPNVTSINVPADQCY
jgi:hypothetical protein